MRRRTFLLAAAGLGAMAAGGAFWASRGRAAPLGFEPDPDALVRAGALIEANPIVDIHAHPGRTFVRQARGLSPALRLYAASGSFEERAFADLRAGGVSAASFAAVADVQVLDFAEGGLVAGREFQPGEAWESYQRQIANLRRQAHAAGAPLALAADDIVAAHHARNVAVFLTVEGGDFLAGDLRRLEQAFADGVRSITLMHYRPNDIGDIQTASPANDGLTDFGADAIREMSRLGIIVDLAHASERTAAQALEVASHPVLCSHTHVHPPNGPGAHPRFISSELARDIVSAGGVIGAWPAGIGLTSLSDFIDRIFSLTDIVGPDHVALGTDMDANFRPVLTSYTQIPLLVSELLRRGYGEENSVRLLGGNFLRVFRAVERARA